MEIVNKVAQSKLEVFDLEDYFPKASVVEMDISIWLEEGFILKEKDFRTKLLQHNWEQYQNKFVAITCTTEAILPAWAKILVASYVIPYASFVCEGTSKDILVQYYQDKLATLDYTLYQDKPVILKGCSKKAVPNEAYIIALQHLQKVAKSIMYGEACSAVPLYRKK